MHGLLTSAEPGGRPDCRIENNACSICLNVGQEESMAPMNRRVVLSDTLRSAVPEKSSSPGDRGSP